MSLNLPAGGWIHLLKRTRLGVAQSAQLSPSTESRKHREKSSTKLLAFYKLPLRPDADLHHRSLGLRRGVWSGEKDTPVC